MTSTNPNDIDSQLKVYLDKIDGNTKDGKLWLEYGDFVSEHFDLPTQVVNAYINAGKYLPGKDLRLRLGEAHVNAGDQEIGLKMISESLQESPRANGFCILAGVYLRIDEFQLAEDAAKRAIALESDFEEAYFLLGEAVRHRSKELAIANYRIAIGKDPEYAIAWQALGRELAYSDQTLDHAVLALHRAIKLNPGDGWAMAYLANAYWRLSNRVNAELWYQNAIETFPDSDEMKDWHTKFKNVSS